MDSIQILTLALVLDYIFGDPMRIWRRIPHPTVLMGMCIDWLDQRLNNGDLRRLKGILSIIILSVLAILLGKFILFLPSFGILSLLVVTSLLAYNDLVKHVRAVALGLQVNIMIGRQEVAKIVGRETADLDQNGVACAAIESAAENFSDSVTAPIFWFIVAGLPGIILYKIVNTADSMIGHQNEKYGAFGYGAAKFDDLLNYIPARLTGGLICLLSGMRHAWDIMCEDAPLHSSPNSGWPEAAMAGVLNIRLAGPRVYEGKLTNDPYINTHGRSNLAIDDIEDSINVINKAWYAIIVVCVILSLLSF